MSVQVLERMFAAFEAGGFEVQQRVVRAWTVRGGKAVRVEAFVDLESAREAAP